MCIKLPAQQRSKSSLLLMKQTRTHQKIEANMFARLYRGYAVNNLIEWVRQVSSYEEPMYSSALLPPKPFIRTQNRCNPITH